MDLDPPIVAERDRVRYLARTMPSPRSLSSVARFAVLAAIALTMARPRADEPDAPNLVAAEDCAGAGPSPVFAPLGATAPVGTIAGSFSVTDTGAAQYAVPIDVPAGRQGLQPTLAIAYSSDAGNGPLGVGFTLAGASSAISRCGSTIGRDGALRAVQFDDGDHFCLDGARLVSVGTTNGDEIFATMPDDFSRIVAKRPSPKADPSVFVVQHKSGIVQRYGETSDARIGGGKGRVRAWALSAVADRFGNEMTFTYEKVAPLPGEDPNYTFEYVPRQIAYTAHPATGLAPSRFLNFEYDDRPDVLRGYRHGVRFEQRRLLRAIESTVHGQTFRRYELSYGQNGSSGRSKLEAIRECAGDGVCKPPTRFEWSQSLEGFEPYVENKATIPKATGAAYHTFIGMDVDGDGLDDLVYPDAAQWNVIFARDVHGRGYRELVRTSARTADGMQDGAKTQALPIDFDHDGRMDLLLLDRSPRWRILRSRGDDFEIVTTNLAKEPAAFGHPADPRRGVQTADLNGDGLQDIVQYRSGGPGQLATNAHWTYALGEATQTGFRFAEERLLLGRGGVVDGGGFGSSTAVIPIDLDGDGKSELLIGNEFVNRFEFFSLSLDAGAWTTRGTDYLVSAGYPSMKMTREKTRFLDVDGDGLTDILTTNLEDGTTKNASLWINTGNGFRHVVDATPGTLFRLSGEYLGLAQVVDYDGDGDDDILIPHRADLYPYADIQSPPDKWFLFRSRGDRFTVEDLGLAYGATVPFLPGEGDWNWVHAQGARLLDARGTGMPDLVTLAPSGNVRVWTRRSDPTGEFRAKPDLLVEIRDGWNDAQPVYDDAEHVHRATIPTIRIDYLKLRDLDHWNDHDAPGVTRPGKRTASSSSGGLQAIQGGPDVYTANRGGCRYPSVCLASGKTVVAAHHLDHGAFDRRRSPDPEPRNERHVYHAYADGRIDRHGRGFLGFSEHAVIDRSSGVTTVRSYDLATYDPTRKFYPGVGHVLAEARFGQGGGVVPDWWSCALHRSRTTPTRGGASWYVADWQVDQDEAERVGLNLQGSLWSYGGAETICSDRVAPAAHASSTTTTTRDEFGNTLRERKEYSAGGALEARRSYAIDTTRWRIGDLIEETITDEESLGSASRAARFGYDPATGGLAWSEQIDGAFALAVRTTLRRDVYGNVVHQLATDSVGSRRASCVGFEPEGVFANVAKNGLGHATSAVIDLRLGAPIDSFDPDGRITHSRYDGFGRPLATAFPDGTTLVRSYGAESTAFGGQFPTLRTTVTGSPEVYTRFDRLGRPIVSRTLDAAGARTFSTTRYDELGRVVGRGLPSPTETPIAESIATYDDRGRPVRTTEPSGATTTFTHDGLVAHVINPRRHATATTLDPRGRPVRVVDTLGHATTYAYGAFGTVAVTDVSGATARHTTDTFGNLRSTVDPNIGNRNAIYNGFGQPLRIDDANGDSTHFAYDPLGRLIRRVDTEGVHEWDYDVTGLTGALSQARTPTTAVTLEYDRHGKLEVQRFGIDRLEAVYRYTYDAAGRISTIQYPTGSPIDGVRHNYRHGYLESVEDRSTRLRYWTAQKRDPFGRVASEGFGNGTRVDFDRDFKSGDVKSVTLYGPTGSAVFGGTYKWDENHNLTEATESFGFLGVKTYEYDPLDRLVTAATTAVRTPTQEAANYDALGNFRDRSDVGPYEYDPARPQHLLRAGTHTFAYDANGRQIRRDGHRIAYTARDNFKTITDDVTGSTVARFEYFADGSRAAKHVEGPDPLHVLTAGGLFEYWYRDSAPHAPTTRAIVMADGQPVVEVTRRAGAPNEVRYLHRDQQGTVRVITDQALGYAEFRNYDAWGKLLPNATGNFGTPVLPPGTASDSTTGFTGHREEPEFGTIHMRGREYDPTIGRFVTPDPFVQAPLFSQSHNRYSYVWNNPKTNTDPTGFATISVEDARTPGKLPHGTYEVDDGSIAIFIEAPKEKSSEPPKNEQSGSVLEIGPGPEAGGLRPHDRPSAGGPAGRPSDELVPGITVEEFEKAYSDYKKRMYSPTPYGWYVTDEMREREEFWRDVGDTALTVGMVGATLLAAEAVLPALAFRGLMFGIGGLSIAGTSSDDSPEFVPNVLSAVTVLAFLPRGFGAVGKAEATAAEAAATRQVGRSGALNQAKQDLGIPRAQHPDSVSMVKMTRRDGSSVLGADGHPIRSREYTYTRPDGSKVVVQDHSAGHQFGQGGVGDQGPHFNVRPLNDTRNGSVPGTRDHYPFKR